MLLFQYLAGRGACLSQRFLPRTGAAPHRLAQRRILMFRSIRKSTSGSIRIINGLNAWCLTRRVRRWHVKGQLTPRLTLAEAKRPTRLYDAFAEIDIPSSLVFDHPAPLAKLRTGTLIVKARQIEPARAHR